jgi:hypothetical protein
MKLSPQNAFWQCGHAPASLFTPSSHISPGSTTRFPQLLTHCPFVHDCVLLQVFGAQLPPQPSGPQILPVH